MATATTYVTVAEAAAIMRVTTKTIRNWIADGRLPAYTASRPNAQRNVIRIKSSDLQKVLSPVEVA